MLSNISKVFEKAIHSRLTSYLNKYELLHNYQFGFRKKHSTTHALVSLTEQIKSALDDGKFACGIFIDIQKAFDTVNHNILLHKLESYGIRGNLNDWFKSFLTARKQFVTIDEQDSPVIELSYGVPQGSVLGPLLFLIYINDFRHCLSKSVAHHFADDTNILFSHTSLRVIRKSLSKELVNVFDWLCANRLSLNAKKTELVLFKPSNKKADNRLTVKFQGMKMFLSNKVNYLGVLIDSSLSWKPHIAELSKKLNRAVAILAKVRHFVPSETLRIIYFSLFQSYLSYGCLVWGFASPNSLRRLSQIQKRAIRVMNFSAFHEPTSPLFARMDILKLQDLIELNRALFMHDWNSGEVPSAIKPLFRYNNSRTTRYKVGGNLDLPNVHTVKYGIRSLRYAGPTLFNNILNLKIDLKSSKVLFKRHLFALLQAKY